MKANTIVNIIESIIASHSLNVSLFETYNKNGAIRCPVSKIVSHAGPSSALNSPNFSEQNEQLSLGAMYRLKSLPFPHLGHRPRIPLHTTITFETLIFHHPKT